PARPPARARLRPVAPGRSGPHELEVGSARPAGTQPVVGREARPVVDDLAGVVLVPARAAGRPRGLRELALQLGVEALRHVGAHVHEASAAPRELLQAARDVARLALDHEDDRVVAEVRVRPVEHEEVREAGYTDAQVTFGAVAPDEVELRAAAPL